MLKFSINIVKLKKIDRPEYYSSLRASSAGDGDLENPWTLAFLSRS
jgi:hypothetical protein